MKKLLTALLLSFTIASTAAASSQISGAERQDGKLTMKYPVVSLENKKAEQKINKHIEKSLVKFQKDAKKSAGLIEGETHYVVHYNDDRYLSFSMIPYIYNGGAHGMYNENGYVFDAATGKRLKYTDFIPELQLEKVRKAIDMGMIKVYSTNSEKPLMNFDTSLLQNISPNFVLKSANTVKLLYQPYVLGSYADGVTCLMLDKATAEKINALP